MADASIAWWNAPKKGNADPNGSEVANAITRRATVIETAQTQKRWRSLVFYRHATGRPNAPQFSYGMAKRPLSSANYYSSFQFTPPRYNLIAACSDVYVNRLMRNHSFLSVVPDRGDFSMRQKSKLLEQWLDATFEETGFWDQWALMGLDAITYGTGILKFTPSADGKKPSVSRIHPDELLYENEDEDNPISVIQRVWANREEINERYGTTPEAREAIKNATSYPAFYFGPGLDCSNVIPLLEGWRLPHINGKPGRHVLVVGNYTVTDEPYKETSFPFESWQFHQLPSGIFGQGLAEILLSINDEIDTLLSYITENIHRCGFPKWLVDNSSDVNPDALGDTSGGVISYTGTKPEQVAPPTTNAEVYQQLERLIRLGLNRAHISEAAVSGEKPGALTSAVALEKWTQIDDSNFAEMGGRLEAFLTRCGYQMIRLGKEVKPTVTLAGKRKQQIKWADLGMTGDKPQYLRAYPMSRLPQTMAGRQQLIDTMLRNGVISKALHTRLSQVPDIDQELDLLNAPTDAVERQLDSIVETGNYIPPTPFLDLEYAIQAAEARYLLEEDDGTPRDRLDTILQYRAAAIDLREQQNTPDGPPAGAQEPAPATPAFNGITPPPGLLPVAKLQPAPNPLNPVH